MITTILTDIEGTTSSLSFVKEVLFPYARERLPAFVVTHADTPEVQFWLHEAAEEADLVSASQQEIIELLINWIDMDRKSPALKALQGMIWEQGYRNREFRAHLYPEVAARLQTWKAEGKKLYVYSSGSVQAQELFFGYSDAGDISALFSGFFDTTTGSKLAADSYLKISEAIGVPAAQILFLSDVIGELDAARSVGMQTTQLARAPATCPIGASHPCVADFDSVMA